MSLVIDACPKPAQASFSITPNLIEGVDSILLHNHSVIYRQTNSAWSFLCRWVATEERGAEDGGVIGSGHGENAKAFANHMARRP